MSEFHHARRFAIAIGLCIPLMGCLHEESNGGSGTASIIPLALNDTGITFCADAETRVLVCPVISHPGQDGESGQDVDNNDNSNGKAGFSFTKLGSAGEALPATSDSWHCVQDNVTNLVWEVKQGFFQPSEGEEPDASRNLHANTNTYTWFDSSRPASAGDPGVENGGNCVGTDSCDTASFVRQVNRAALCGFRDWRMPSRTELRSIVDYGVNQPGPTVDIQYFANTRNPDQLQGLHSDWYWSFQTSARLRSSAWAVSFNTGGDSRKDKNGAQSVRLVRGGL